MLHAYIGSYTPMGGAGIYRAGVNESGLHVQPVAECQNPSYLALSPDRGALYAALECQTYQGQPGGAVRSYQVGPEGALRLTGERLTGGKDPCYLSTDPAGRWLFCANYSEGTASVFSLEADGALGTMLSEVRHRGKGADPVRQEMAHVHQALLTPDGTQLALTDLGLDELVLYAFDPQHGVGARQGALPAPPGCGPRHAAFNGTICYLACELTSELLVFDNWASPRPELLQRLSAVEGHGQPSYLAALKLSPDHRQLLVTNRGEDSLALFDILPGGRLALAQRLQSGGHWPRDASFSPDGNWLMAANQHEGGLMLFRYANGRLIPWAQQNLAQPCCVIWM